MNSKIELTLESNVYSYIKDLLLDLKNVSNADKVELGDRFEVKFID